MPHARPGRQRTTPEQRAAARWFLAPQEPAGRPASGPYRRPPRTSAGETAISASALRALAALYRKGDPVAETETETAPPAPGSLADREPIRRPLPQSGYLTASPAALRALAEGDEASRRMGRDATGRPVIQHASTLAAEQAERDAAGEIERQARNPRAVLRQALALESEALANVDRLAPRSARRSIRRRTLPGGPARPRPSIGGVATTRCSAANSRPRALDPRPVRPLRAVATAPCRSRADEPDPRVRKSPSLGELVADGTA